MSEPTQWHYTDRSGKQVGPATTEELLQLIFTQTIPTSSMAWKNGMPAWKPVSQIEELQAPLSTPVTAPPVVPTIQSPSNTKTTKIDPYEAPKSNQLEPPPEVPLSYSELHGTQENYDGIGRFSYILLRPLLYIILGVPLLIAILIFTGSDFISSGFLVFLIFLFIRLHWLRFRNIGMSPWWTLALPIPIVNLPLYLMLHICPPGYSYTRKLDLAGKILAFFVIGIPLLFIVLSIIFDMSSAYADAANKAKDEIDHQKSKHKKEQVQPPAQESVPQ